MAYEVIEPLEIPREAYERPIHPSVLHVFGISKDAEQSDLHLAQVALIGSNTTQEDWLVVAVDAVATPSELKPGDQWGAVMVEGRQPADAVIDESDNWVRESESTLWVPGPPLELEVDERSFRVVLLVRGAGAIAMSGPDPEPAQPEPRRRHFLGFTRNR